MLPLEGAGEEVDEPERCAVAEAELQDQVRVRRSAREDITGHLAILIERTLDTRASSMIRALLAEENAFPELHRRYFAEIVTPRREVMYRLIRRGIATGEIRPDADVAFVNEMLVGPVLARLGSGATAGLDPEETSRRITDLIFRGIQPR